MTSSRLPGKALRPIAGKPLSRWCLERAELIGVPVVLCTSTDPSDDILADSALKWGFGVFRGDLLDVSIRARDCCLRHRIERFVRVCGDSPFHDHAVARSLLAMCRREDLDYARDVTVGRQSHVEVFSFNGISAVAERGNTTEREHIGLMLRKGEFRTATLQTGAEDAPLTVDTERDLKRAGWIMLKKPTSQGQIVRLAKQWESKQEAW